MTEDNSKELLSKREHLKLYVGYCFYTHPSTTSGPLMTLSLAPHNVEVAVQIPPR